jgi:hypothetical protein
MNAIDLLVGEHRELESLFRRYETLRDGQAKSLFDKLEIAVSKHAAIEEEYLYPALRECVTTGDLLADKALAEHQEVKETLAALEQLDPGSAEFDVGVAKVIRSVRTHIQQEEHDPGLFPLLRQRLSVEQLEALGESLASAQQTAPTRPHPHAPNKPPANKIASIATAAIDRARDALTRRGQD